MTERYAVIYADPPWRFEVRDRATGLGRSADAWYDTMTFPALKALRARVDALAAPDCALFLWVTDPFIQVGMELLEAWGFEYKTVALYWVKTNKDGSFFKGTGYWTRANPEQCWLATRGRPARLSGNVDRLIVAPRREHSRKPEEAYERIGALVAGPYIELFARAPRPGWASWGNETGAFAGGATPRRRLRADGRHAFRPRKPRPGEGG